MLCEKCQGEIETIRCIKCGEAIMPMGNYCYLCGADLRQKEHDEEDESIDLLERVLCSDGTCIGVVENGVCKLCGKPYTPET
ncbi:MAG: zinc ribbon domain-containing protein [Syntrophorhabdales bacterium]|nr:zinc ribbon domain-containing protein [Syntrophorhabdales bacterium]